jgi:hypothetical protein
MSLNNVPNIRKGKYYVCEIDTKLGVLQMELRYKNHLFCNFIDHEEKAKLIFGHWKLNIIVEDLNDILLHLIFIDETFEEYKNKLKNGMV